MMTIFPIFPFSVMIFLPVTIYPSHCGFCPQSWKFNRDPYLHKGWIFLWLIIGIGSMLKLVEISILLGPIDRKVYMDWWGNYCITDWKSARWGRDNATCWCSNHFSPSALLEEEGLLQYYIVEGGKEANVPVSYFRVAAPRKWVLMWKKFHSLLWGWSATHIVIQLHSKRYFAGLVYAFDAALFYLLKRQNKGAKSKY